MGLNQYTYTMPKVASLAVIWAVMPQCALAHPSEQGFVLLLPTDFYIASGVACVALTVLLLTVLPERYLSRAFGPVPVAPWRSLRHARTLVSCLSSVCFLALLWAGLNGPRDPLANPLPLSIWTVFWIGMVSVQGVFGDIWRWLNPWSGPVAVTRRALKIAPFLRLPARIGHGGAILTFLAFAVFLLADPAPSDPARLAVFAGGYWLFTYIALLAFGPRWALRGEGFTVLMRSYASLAISGRAGRRLALGLTGWQALRRPAPALGLAVFLLLMLGTGSFDGLNETFWWLDLIGINPLEFPGRTAVILQNVIGLAVANAALIAAYALTVWAGLRLIAAQVPLTEAFCLFAPSILPIALGYHIAHYLTSFLVDGQYVLVVLNDPLARGDSVLGLGTFYVSTGFFNASDSVRLIWLTQAAAVVIGHVLAVMMAHAFALRRFGSTRRAALSQAPLALFMVFYTLFGLWLLASPRGA